MLSSLTCALCLHSVKEFDYSSLVAICGGGGGSSVLCRSQLCKINGKHPNKRKMNVNVKKELIFLFLRWLCRKIGRQSSIIFCIISLCSLFLFVFRTRCAKGKYRFCLQLTNSVNWLKNGLKVHKTPKKHALMSTFGWKCYLPMSVRSHDSAWPRDMIY